MIPHSNTGNRPSIALVGLAGVGKNVLADYITATYGHMQLSFAAPLKRAVQSIYHFSDAQLFGPSRLRDEPDPRYLRADGTGLTPREALERIGTDACRKCYEETWLDLAMLDASKIAARGGKWVFTDARYVNEMDACRARGALIVRLTRTGIVAGGHESEAHALLPDERFDLVLSTDGTIEETRRKFSEWFSKQ